MTEAIVNMTDLIRRNSGSEVLNISHFSVEKGETVAIYGPNGSGKSTLLRIIALIEPYDQGRLTLFDGDAGQARARLAYRRRMAVVFDQPIVYKNTVRSNVAIGLKIRSLPKSEVTIKVDEALELLKISHLKDRPANQLSRGEAQRVCLARALALQPELLLLDEPLSGLDSGTKRSMIKELQEILNRSGLASIYVSHDLKEVRALADRLVFLDNGRIKGNINEAE